MIKFLTFLALVSSAIAVAPSEGNGIHIDCSSLIQAINLYAERNAFPRLKATEAEFVRTMETDQGEALYIDFNGDNGYAVLKDSTILRYDVVGDYPEIRSEDVKMENYRFYGKNGEVNGCEIDRDTFVAFDPYDANCEGDKHPIEYNNISSYLLAKYGASNVFSITSSDKLDGLPANAASSGGYTQSEDSVFYHWSQEKQAWFSEGNCGLTSTSNALAYYAANSGIGTFPSTNATVTVNPLNETVYYRALENHYQARSDSEQIHTIYNAVRSAAISYTPNGYVSGGMNFAKTKYAYETAASSFLAIGDYSSLDSYYSLSFIQNHIALNHPLQLNMQGDAHYDDHGTMMTGYRVYYSLTEVGGFVVPLQVVMASIYDGHSNTERWYDMVQLGNGGAYFKRASGVSVALYTIGSLL